MIEFEEFTLNNGLQVIVHTDKATPMVAVNILYKVGARNENPQKTGFAHLFEHLMFGGSVNIPSYDEPLQLVGGENNAFTTNDITNYHITLPAQNIETAFWLESDRMLSLAFTKKSLEVQRNVVIEEFRQRYLNQPYGDVWLHLRPLAYKVHPYKWATIGKNIEHIKNATLTDVKDFFYSYYAPNNAIMSIAGNVDAKSVKILISKWFGPIEKRIIKSNIIPTEPKQLKTRRLTLERDVPASAIYIAFKMPPKAHSDYKVIDTISDILGNGKSSLLYQQLVMIENICSDVECYITGSIDTGLIVVEAKLNSKVNFKTVEQKIFEVINNNLTKISTEILKKVLNKATATLQYSYIDILNKATNLAYYEMLGNANLINTEIEEYRKIKINDIKTAISNYLNINSASILYYKSKKSEKH